MKPSVWKKFKHDSKVGYFIECDIDYQDRKLHTKISHHNYPLLPNQELVKFSDLSPAAKKLLIKKVGLKAAKRYKSRKLISSFRNKKKIIIHYMTFKQALEKGLTVRRIRRVVGFYQSPWAKSFIDEMTRRRSSAMTSFEEKQFKFIGMNSILLITCNSSRS